MVHNVVDLLWFEFVLYRHDDCTIGDNSQESYCPLATISTADGNLVALLHIAVFKQDMQFLYLSCNIVVLECSALIIGERIQVPILDDASLNIRVKTWY